MRKPKDRCESRVETEANFLIVIGQISKMIIYFYLNVSFIAQARRAHYGIDLGKHPHNSESDKSTDTTDTRNASTKKHNITVACAYVQWQWAECRGKSKRDPP